MKKIYYVLSLFLASGLFVACSNDLNGTDDIVPADQQTSVNLKPTRSFPKDDGAVVLTGTPAEKILCILNGADKAFSARMGNYTHPNDEEYAEIKAFADSLVEGASSETVKWRRIFNWVVENVKYGQADNNPYPVFINRKGVCQGYSNLLSVMLISQGIPVVSVNGFVNWTTYYGHAWNYAFCGGVWRLSDATNDIEYKAEEKIGEYKDLFIPVSADGNFIETDNYTYKYEDAKINLNTVKFSEDALVVPFSVAMADGNKYQIDMFSPSEDLPENITEVYLGKNIQSLGYGGIIGLRDHGKNIAAVHVDPENPYLESYEGVIYQAYNDEPYFIPAAMETVYLKPTFNGVIGKNFLYNHPGVLEVYIPEGTTSVESWAVENCPELLVAYIPVGTEVAENAFVGCHTDFQIIWLDQTGIGDVLAD